jgi:hypothetical protein
MAGQRMTQRTLSALLPDGGWIRNGAATLDRIFRRGRDTIKAKPAGANGAAGGAE